MTERFPAVSVVLALWPSPRVPSPASAMAADEQLESRIATFDLSLKLFIAIAAKSAPSSPRRCVSRLEE